MIYGYEGAVLDVGNSGTPQTTTGFLAIAAKAWLQGFTISELTGTGPAKVVVWSGQDANGDWADTINVPSGGTYRANPGQPGVPCPGGIFFQVVTGTVSISATYGRWVKAK